jgi:hypothetical protein
MFVEQLSFTIFHVRFCLCFLHIQLHIPAGGLTEAYRDLLGPTGTYLGLPGLTGSYRDPPGAIATCQDLPGPTGAHRALPDLPAPTAPRPTGAC